MNKKELYMFIRSINIGDEFYNLELNLDGTASLTFNSMHQTNKLISILQELARERKMQFKIDIGYISSGTAFNMKRCIKYTVVNPTSNFLHCRGIWKLSRFRIAKEILQDYRDKTNYYWEEC